MLESASESLETAFLKGTVNLKFMLGTKLDPFSSGCQILC